MEHKQQIVGADGRVLGEQDEECQDAPRHSCGKEQHEVYSPKRFLSAYAVEGGGCGQYKQQQGGLQRGESFGRLSRLFHSGCYDFLFVQYQGAHLLVSADEPGCVEVILHVERDEHHQSAADGLVGLAAHAQIHAET